jgi:hypothetical protein
MDHAGCGRSGGRAVQVCGLGGAGSGGPPAAGVRSIVNEVPALLERAFAALYAPIGRPVDRTGEAGRFEKPRLRGLGLIHSAVNGGGDSR